MVLLFFPLFLYVALERDCAFPFVEFGPPFLPGLGCFYVPFSAYVISSPLWQVQAREGAFVLIIDVAFVTDSSRCKSLVSLGMY